MAQERQAGTLENLLFPSPALIFLLVLLHMVINEIGIENENESFKMFGSGDLVKRKEINKMIKIR